MIKEKLIKLIESTDNFHKRFGVKQLNVNQKDFNDRLRMQIEEVGEMAKATSYEQQNEMVEESVDVAVVAIGTLLLLEDKALNAIQKVIDKNNSKNLTTHKYENGKILRKDI